MAIIGHLSLSINPFLISYLSKYTDMSVFVKYNTTIMIIKTILEHQYIILQFLIFLINFYSLFDFINLNHLTSVNRRISYPHYTTKCCFLFNNTPPITLILIRLISCISLCISEYAEAPAVSMSTMLFHQPVSQHHPLPMLKYF